MIGIRIFSLPVTLLTSIILARQLEPAYFGEYAFSMALAEALALPVGLGLRALIIRKIATFEENSRLRSAYQLKRSFEIIVLAYSLFVMFVSAVLFISMGLTFRPLALAVCLVPCLAIFELYSAFFQGISRPVEGQLFQLLLRPFVFLLLVSGFSYFGFLSIYSAALSFLVASVLVMVLIVIAIRFLFPAETSDADSIHPCHLLRSPYSYFLLIAATQFASMNAGVLFLGATGNSFDAAGMRIAQSAGLLVMVPVVAIEILTQPKLAQHAKQNDIKSLINTYKQGTVISFVSTLFIGLPLILYTEELLTLTFGPGYIEVATESIRLLAGARIFQAFVGISGPLLVMSSHEKLAFWAQASSFVVSIILISVFAPEYGATGAALGLAVGLVLKSSLETFLCRIFLGRWVWLFMGDERERLV